MSVVDRLVGRCCLFLTRLLQRGLVFQDKVRFEASDALNLENGSAIVRGRIDYQAVTGSELILGNRVMFNSDSDSYPHFMHSCVKLRLLRENSIVKIGERTRIHGSCITCYERVEIGERCLIAANSQIMDAGGHRICPDDVTKRITNVGFDTDPVIIEDDVWIGLGVIVLPGVRIGRGSVIAAGAVVSKSIPEMVIAGGIPAKVLKQIK